MSAETTEARWDRRYAEEAWSDTPDELLVERLVGVRPGRALDLACGPGRNAVHLARRGWSVLGVDLSAVGLAQAAERAAAAGVTLELVRDDVRRLRPAPASVDLVVVANLHLSSEERRPFFATAVAALRPGGHLFLLGHRPDSGGRPMRLGPERGYTPELLADLLAPCTVEVRQLEQPRSDGHPPTRRLAAWASAPDPSRGVALC